VILCESDIFSIDESWLPLPLPATESNRHIEAAAGYPLTRSVGHHIDAASMKDVAMA